MSSATRKLCYCAIAKMTARCALYKWIESPVAEIWPFAYLGGIWNPICGEGKVVRVSDGTIRKSDGSFL